MTDRERELEKQKRSARERELDAFWDIDSLIPARRSPIYPSNTETAEVVIEPKREAPQASTASVSLPRREDAPVRHFIPPHTAAEERRLPVPDEEYEPDSALIRRVRLFCWKNEYH